MDAITNSTAVVPQSASKRTKHVFSTDEIPHLWAHQTQDYARNAKKSFYFDGTGIFSYRTVIAWHYQYKGKPCILFGSEQHSPTTTRHQALTRQAIPDSIPVFTVPQISIGRYGNEHGINCDYYRDEIRKEMEKAAKAKLEWNRTHHLEQAANYRLELIAYCRFFDMKREKLPLTLEHCLPAIRKALNVKQAADSLATRIESKRGRIHAYATFVLWLDGDQENQTYQFRKLWESFTPEQREAYQAEHDKNESAWRVIRNAEIARKLVTSIDQWKRDEAVDSYSLRTLPYALLRVEIHKNRDAEIVRELVTSQGVRIPIGHAYRALLFVRKVVASGQNWKTNGHTFHVGPYAIETVSASGELKAGCHVIQFAEIERVAPQVTAAYVAEQSH